MHSKIESLKANIQAGFLSGVLPGPQTDLIGFKDMLQVRFDSGVSDTARVRVGEYFRYRPSVVIEYSLNIQMSSGGGLKFSWKNSMKPVGFIEIEDRIKDLYSEK